MYGNYGRPPRRPSPRGVSQRGYSEEMTLGKWMGTFFILLIPGINIIAMLVWLFGGGKNRSRVNYIRAALLFSVILTVIGVILAFTAGNIIWGYLKELIEKSQNFIP